MVHVGLWWCVRTSALISPTSVIFLASIRSRTYIKKQPTNHQHTLEPALDPVARSSPLRIYTDLQKVDAISGISQGEGCDLFWSLILRAYLLFELLESSVGLLAEHLLLQLEVLQAHRHNEGGTQRSDYNAGA